MELRVVEGRKEVLSYKEPKPEGGACQERERERETGTHKVSPDILISPPACISLTHSELGNGSEGTWLWMNGTLRIGEALRESVIARVSGSTYFYKRGRDSREPVAAHSPREEKRNTFGSRTDCREFRAGSVSTCLSLLSLNVFLDCQKIRSAGHGRGAQISRREEVDRHLKCIANQKFIGVFHRRHVSHLCSALLNRKWKFTILNSTMSPQGEFL
jgi:hypothetical protein